MKASYLYLAGLTAIGLLQQGYAVQRIIAGYDFSQRTDQFEQTNFNDWSPGTVGDIGYTFQVGALSDIHDGFGGPAIRSYIYWNGQYGSTAYNYVGIDKDILAYVGVTNGAGAIPINVVENGFWGTQFSNTSPYGVAESLGFNGVNGSFVISLNTLGFDNIQFSYAAMQANLGTYAADSISWEYSVDGMNYTAFGGAKPVNVGDFTATSIDFSSISLVNNQANVYFRGTLAGGIGGHTGLDSVMAIDNILFLGSEVAIPEPSTVGIFAGIASMGLLYWRRRRA